LDFGSAAFTAKNQLITDDIDCLLDFVKREFVLSAVFDYEDMLLLWVNFELNIFQPTFDYPKSDIANKFSKPILCFV